MVIHICMANMCVINMVKRDYNAFSKFEVKSQLMKMELLPLSRWRL